MTRTLGSFLSIVKPDCFRGLVIAPVKRPNSSEMGVFALLNREIARLLNEAIGAESPRFSIRSVDSFGRFAESFVSFVESTLSNGLRVFNSLGLIARQGGAV